MRLIFITQDLGGCRGGEGRRSGRGRTWAIHYLIANFPWMRIRRAIGTMFVFQHSLTKGLPLRLLTIITISGPENDCNKLAGNNANICYRVLQCWKEAEGKRGARGGEKVSK